MNNIRVWIYQLVPPKWRNTLGKSTLLSPLRNLLFRNPQGYREVKVRVKRPYENYTVDFEFYASIQVASKAETRGIENTLLRNSITLLKRYKPKKAANYTIIDVGANFGYLSMVWAQTVAKEGSVYSFEPHPQLFGSLNRTVYSNKLETIVRLENLAVGLTSKKIILNLSNASSNLLELNNTQTEKKPIEMVSIDDYYSENKLEECDLIKIDVDGIEMEILKGAKETIKKFSPILIVETNGNEEIVSYMDKLEYKTLTMNLEEYNRNFMSLPSNAFIVPC